MSRPVCFAIAAFCLVAALGCDKPKEKQETKVAAGLSGIGNLAPKASAEPEPSAVAAVDADEPKLWETKPTASIDVDKYNTLIDIRIQEARECHRKPDPEKLTVDLEVEPSGKIAKSKLSGHAYEDGDKACIDSHFKRFAGPPFEGSANQKLQRHGFLYKQDKKE